MCKPNGSFYCVVNLSIHPGKVWISGSRAPCDKISYNLVALAAQLDEILARAWFVAESDTVFKWRQTRKLFNIILERERKKKSEGQGDKDSRMREDCSNDE